MISPTEKPSAQIRETIMTNKTIDKNLFIKHRRYFQKILERMIDSVEKKGNNALE